ncbi:MAG: hypothetical protein SGBAC_006407 [Bacillariaceae sp.]
MPSSGGEGDEKKPTQEESSEKAEKMVNETNESTHLPAHSSPKHAQLHQTISGANATSVAALRRSGLRFTDVYDPNALRVQIPEPGDVLFGRGRGFQEHPGNQRMLKIISKYKQAYKSQKRSKKREFVEAVYDEITKDGGRFVKKLEGENCWVEVSIPISLEKVSHTLRGKRKGEEDIAPASTEVDTTNQLLSMQKRRRVSTDTDSPTRGERTRLQGLGGPLLPSSATSMTAATLAANGPALTLQKPMQSVFANQQFGAASQLFPNNASVLSSMPQGLSAFNGHPSSATLSAYGNPYMLGSATSSLYGFPQLPGSNPQIGIGSMYGVPSLYGASSLDTARFELLREQQQQRMRASAGSNNPLLASQQGLPPSQQGLPPSNSVGATPPVATQPSGSSSPGALDASGNRGKAAIGNSP